MLHSAQPPCTKGCVRRGSARRNCGRCRPCASRMRTAAGVRTARAGLRLAAARRPGRHARTRRRAGRRRRLRRSRARDRGRRQPTDARARVRTRAHAPHPPRLPARRAALDAQLQQEDPRPDRRRVRRLGRRGLLEHLDIDGERRYFERAASNLFRLERRRRSRAATRSSAPLSEGPIETPHPHHAEVRDAALAAGTTSVAPRRVRVTHSLTVEADAVPAGKTDPRVDSVPARDRRASRKTSATSPARRRRTRSRPNRRCSARSTSSSGASPASRPTFSVTYELTIYGAVPRDRSGQGRAGRRPTPSSRRILAERPPHVVFTDAMRAFSRAGRRRRERIPTASRASCSPPSTTFPWAGAREYSTITNISDYALHAGHADCGQQTLLLITLLRLNGIPARWQSGWVYLRRRLRQPARLGLAVPRAVRLGADGRHLRPLRRHGDPDASRVLLRRPRRLPHRLQRRLRHATSCRPSSTSVPRPSTCSAAKSSGTAATCTSTSGITTSTGEPCCRECARATRDAGEHTNQHLTRGRGA